MTKRDLILIILIVLFLPGLIQGTIPASERAVLITFYNVTNGDGWTDNTGWKGNNNEADGFSEIGSEGSWKGVTVLGGHVVTLYLYDNLLTGTIPPEISDLAYLQRLNLGKNQLTGSIPQALGDLTALEWLTLSSNELTGSIPQSLGNLSNLRALWIVTTDISGSIPSELGNCSQLTSLRLPYNQLSGSIPSELAQLSNLTEMWISNNQLSGNIPPELGSMTNLQALNMSTNQLHGEIPTTLMNLTNLTALGLGWNCLWTTDTELIAWLDTNDSWWDFQQNYCGTPSISLNRDQLNFGAVSGGVTTPPQDLSISNPNINIGTLRWGVTSNQPWLTCNPTSGTNSGVASVSVNASGLSNGIHTATVTVADSNAANSPQTVAVTLKVYGAGQTASPFGSFATPVEGAAVSSSVPVTGWALDDVGIDSVKIYNGTTYVGDALFLEGARPDVEQAYPDLPMNYRAGWGYMLLTNFLPLGGNGTYTLYAKARDLEGNEITLGSKTITVDNENAVKPFGAIDTPTQGGIASGSQFLNWGWVLTPQPDSLPTDGSTLNVYVNGVNLGHPVYNLYREDIATFFPGYANSNGAAGYFILDTTAYDNGVHTIQWTATDSGNDTDGIGSRFFSIQNSSSSNTLFGNNVEDISTIPFDETAVTIKRGFARDSLPLVTKINSHKDFQVKIKELEPLKIELRKGLSITRGYQMVGDKMRPIPAGMMARGNILNWMPGIGFQGNYRILLLIKNESGAVVKKLITVTIEPKFKLGIGQER